MLQGIEYLRSARRHLADEDIEQAAEHFWKAMFYLDKWPAALERRANALLPLMFKAGPIAASVGQLDPAERASLHRQMLALIEEALRGEEIGPAASPAPHFPDDGPVRFNAMVAAY